MSIYFIGSFLSSLLWWNHLHFFHFHLSWIFGAPGDETDSKSWGRFCKKGLWLEYNSGFFCKRRHLHCFLCSNFHISTSPSQTTTTTCNSQSPATKLDHLKHCAYFHLWVTFQWFWHSTYSEKNFPEKHYAIAVTRNNKSPISTHAFEMLIWAEM
jgi:hypothetical protein